jgi:hypothetical protein
MNLEELPEALMTGGATVAGTGLTANVLDGPQTEGHDRFHDVGFCDSQAVTKHATAGTFSGRGSARAGFDLIHRSEATLF